MMMAGMEKYRRVRKATQSRQEEVRIRTTGSLVASVETALRLLQEENKTHVVLTGTGRAMSNVVQVAEILKRLIPDLHQLTVSVMQDIIDEFEPLEEGLDPLQKVRRVPSLEITLTPDVTLVDSLAVGYQAPLEAEGLSPDALEELKKDEAMWKGRFMRRRGDYGVTTYRGYRGRGRGRPQPDPRPQNESYPQTQPPLAPGAAQVNGRGTFPQPARGRGGTYRGGSGFRGPRRGRARGTRGGMGMEAEDPLQPVVA